MVAETTPSGAANYPDSMPVARDSDAALATTTTAAPREALGTMIGRYKLLQEIGEGGFGIVYMADQMEPVKRKVALKVLTRIKRASSIATSSPRTSLLVVAVCNRRPAHRRLKVPATKPSSR